MIGGLGGAGGGELALGVEAPLAAAWRDHDGRGPFAPEEGDAGVDAADIDEPPGADVHALQRGAVVALRLLAVDAGLDVAEVGRGDGGLGDPLHVEDVEGVGGGGGGGDWVG